jgi:hypothetical protein
MTDDPDNTPTPPAMGGVLPDAPESYQRTLNALVECVQAARVRALRSVNQELVLLYWDIGREILDRQEQEGWGAKVVDRLARDLRTLFPDMGMSARNLKYMRAFAKAWPDPEIVQGGLAQSPADRKVPQPVAQIPWGHIRTLLDLCKNQLQNPSHILILFAIYPFASSGAGALSPEKAALRYRFF